MKFLAWIARLFARTQDSPTVRYRDILYQPPAFDERISLEQIQKTYPRGHLREAICKAVVDRFPGRHDFHCEYLYCVWQGERYSLAGSQAMLARTVAALERTPAGADRDRMIRLHDEIEATCAKLVKDYGPNPLPPQRPDPDTVQGLITLNRESAALGLFTTLRSIVVPKSIAYSNERDQQRLWEGFEAVIQLHLDRQQPDHAFALLEEFQNARRSVGLSPIPTTRGVQEDLVGYVLRADLERARSLVRSWLESSKTPYIWSAVRDHPSFIDLCHHLITDWGVDKQLEFEPVRPVPGAYVISYEGRVVGNMLSQPMQQFLGRCIAAVKRANVAAKGTNEFAVYLSDANVKLPLDKYWKAYLEDENVEVFQQVVAEARRLVGK